MRRERWTILQWCTKTCGYTRRFLNEPLAPLFIRGIRIPHIDKIAHRPPDPRIPKFVEAVKSSTEAPKLLLKWMPTLSHDTLEEFAIVLALHKGLDAIPKEVLARLKRIGSFPYMMQEIKESHDEYTSPKTIPQARPVDILALPLPDSGAHYKQKLIDDTLRLGPQLSKFQNSWKRDLQRYCARSVQDPALEAHLPFDEQCTIVSQQLTLVCAEIANVPFPRSLSRLCRKLGDALEHGMLGNVAREEGVPYVHRRSRYLWGLIGQPRWTVKQRIIRGSWWIEQVLKHCRFDLVFQGRSMSRPAFWRTWHMDGSTKRGIFVLNQSFLTMLRQDPDASRNHITACQIPLLVPPRPWTGLRATSGPAASRELTLIASNGHSTEGQATIKEAIASGSMQPHLDGLNRLSQQAWQINTRVLNIVEQLGPQAFMNSGTKDSKRNSSMQWQQALQVARGLGSQRFYLPTYLDFRGRVYAFSGTILNYMGRDPMRALFNFGEKKRVGPHGLHWLEVHLANMYGMCKSQTEEQKRSWVESSREDIIRSSRTPLQHDWWRSAAKPFQALAACFELSDAWSCEDPSLFETQLPVQIDGTCNGLQHLVSLALDERNAEHVNIVKRSDGKCGDVYAAAAKAVSADSDSIDRRTVKEAVMTFFYGASLHRMLESLREQGVEAPLPLAQRIRECLEAMFKRERDIQKWLFECARRIVSSCRADQALRSTTVSWTSPLGMPVVQPYGKSKIMAVRTPLQTFYLRSDFHQTEIDREKQLTGVVANFIHSLDAAHMLATCRALPIDISFGAVHDSFWARAGDVPLLGRVLREQFVRMHSSNLLSELRQEWEARYRGFVVLGKVYKDSPLYEKIIWLRNGVTSGRKQEACLEKELRQWYESNASLIPATPAQWDGGSPFLGTPGLSSVKLWFPLEFPMPPQQGALDIRGVLDSPHFFS